MTKIKKFKWRYIICSKELETYLRINTFFSIRFDLGIQTQAGDKYPHHQQHAKQITLYIKRKVDYELRTIIPL